MSIDHPEQLLYLACLAYALQKGLLSTFGAAVLLQNSY